jgi:hypothetical protein
MMIEGNTVNWLGATMPMMGALSAPAAPAIPADTANANVLVTAGS